MGAAPQGPCDDGGGLDLASGQTRGDTADFRHRPADQWRLLRILGRRGFGGGGGVGWGGSAAQQEKGQQNRRAVPLPAVPGTGLVMVETEFVFGGLEAVLDGPAPPLDRYQGFHVGPGRAPGGEKGQGALGDGAGER